jgi:hypothetical protein
MAAARSTVKAQRDKLARFSAKTVFLATKPGSKITLPPRSAVLSPWSDVRNGVRAGACQVPSGR